MKNLIRVFYALPLIFIVACSSDDSVSLNVSNQFMVGDDVYNIATPGFINLGDVLTTSQGSFALSDKDISISSSPSFEFHVKTSILVILTFVSPGTGGLSSGDYEKGDNLGSGSKKFFLVKQVKLGSTTHTVDSGTVTLQGSSPNFTLKFDLLLNGGQKITGGYSGEFVTN